MFMTPIDEFEALLPGTGGDPYPTFARLRQDAPVEFSQAIDGWVVTRWADVTRVFEDADHFTPMEAGSGSSAIYGRTILHMTGEEHRRKRAILARRLRNPKRLSGDIGCLVADLVQEHGDTLVDGPASSDVKTAFTSPIPLDVIGALMTMRGAAAFPDWYHQIVAASISNVTGDLEIHQRGVAARDDLFEWLDPEIEAKRAEPADDLLSDLCTVSYEGEALTNAEVKAFCAFLLSAGIETTDRALVNLCRELIELPDQWQLLKDDRDLVPSAIAEILRLRPPVQASIRQAAVDTELGDREIRRGQKLMVLLGSANHDETVFDRADEFDVSRFVDNSAAQYTPAAQNRGFGGGAHNCTGSLLAKLEMEEALRYLLERFDRMEFAGPPPPDEGFVLRSAPSLDLVLHAS